MTMIAQTRAVVRTFSLACLTIASPIAAKTFTADQTNLTKTLNAMGPGDTVILSPGGYGVVTVPRKSWLTPINIDARAASFTGIVIFRASGVNWTGGRVIGTGYGVSIRDVERVTLTGAEISDAVRGIVINNGTDVKILKNKLHDLQTDGIDVIGERILVEGNVITDMKPLPGDHPDGIQLWSANDKQTRDITIRNNTVTGMTQGIFARAQVLGLKNITVTGNKVTVAYGNGIVLLDSTNGMATGNTVKSTAVRINKANMRAEGANNIMCGNVVPEVPKATANLPCKG